MKDNLIKILGVLLVTGSVCVGIAFWVKKNMPEQDLSASILKSFADKDSDHDGLSDNMESIYGSDYMDPDSDGDGFLDGEEVLSGYDPMKPAPNDILSVKYAIMPRPAAGSMKDLNFTESIVAQLTTKVTGGEISPLKEGDLTTIANPSSVEEAIEAAIGRSYQEFSIQNIPSDQLNIILNNSEESIKKYAGEATVALGDIKNIPIGNSRDELKNTADIVTSYESAVLKLKQIQTPSNLIATHKKQIGLLIMQANVLKSIANTEADPLKANIAMSRIDLINQTTVEILQEIQSAIEAHIQ